MLDTSHGRKLGHSTQVLKMNTGGEGEGEGDGEGEEGGEGENKRD